MVVIVVIGILLAAWLSLNWWSLEKLRAKASSEQVSSFFDTVFLQIQASNYEQWKSFTGVDIVIEKWKNAFDYIYHLKKDDTTEGGSYEWDVSIPWAYWGKFVVSDLSWDVIGDLDKVTVSYTPFHPECTFSIEDSIGIKNLEDKHIFFSVQPRSLKKSCFEINSKYCKVQSIACEEGR